MHSIRKMFNLMIEVNLFLQIQKVLVIIIYLIRQLIGIDWSDLLENHL